MGIQKKKIFGQNRKEMDFSPPTPPPIIFFHIWYLQMEISTFFWQIVEFPYFKDNIQAWKLGGGRGTKNFVFQGRGAPNF